MVNWKRRGVVTILATIGCAVPGVAIAQVCCHGCPKVECTQTTLGCICTTKAKDPFMEKLMKRVKTPQAPKKQ